MVHMLSRSTVVLGFAILLNGLSAPAQATLNVFACEPEWAALAQELGGDRLVIYSATTAHQDPHHIQARPSLIAKARKADLLACTGAELEVGWLPLLLRRAGNARIQPGQPGHFQTFDYVEMLEVPEKLDRSLGDIHASGNPHIHTDPRNILRIAGPLSQRLQTLDSENAEYYSNRYDAFRTAWEVKLDEWKSRAVPLEGLSIVAHHNFWPYMNRWLGLNQVDTLEPLPGVMPSSSHLAAVKKHIAEKDVRVIIRVGYANERPANWMASKTGLPIVVLPASVDFHSEQKLDEWYDTLITSMTNILQ
jgi:zinc/manganese transport system substrate-binding protein